MISNDLDPVRNITYCCWDFIFDRSLKWDLHQLCRSNLQDFALTTFIQVPINRRRSCCYTQNIKPERFPKRRHVLHPRDHSNLGLKSPRIRIISWGLIILHSIYIGMMLLKMRLLRWFIINAFNLNILTSNHLNNINVIDYTQCMIWNLI